MLVQNIGEKRKQVIGGPTYSSVVVVVAAVGTLLAPVDLGSNVVRHVHLVQHQVACQPS